MLLLVGRYTPLDQAVLPELLPLCVRRKIKLVIGGPLNAGILATGVRSADARTLYFNHAPATPDIVARCAAIEYVCAGHGVALKAATLQFPRTLCMRSQRMPDCRLEVSAEPQSTHAAR